MPSIIEIHIAPLIELGSDLMWDGSARPVDTAIKLDFVLS